MDLSFTFIQSQSMHSCAIKPSVHSGGLCPQPRRQLQRRPSRQRRIGRICARCPRSEAVRLDVFHANFGQRLLALLDGPQERVGLGMARVVCTLAVEKSSAARPPQAAGTRSGVPNVKAQAMARVLEEINIATQATDTASLKRAQLQQKTALAGRREEQGRRGRARTTCASLRACDLRHVPCMRARAG